MRILTFDIEEWFHILDHESTKLEAQWSQFECRIHENLDRILALLKERNVSATFFCLGWIAERYPEAIRRIDQAGYEIGTHSYWHQLVYEQDPQTFRKDLTRSIAVLEDATGKKIRAYRAPGFSLKKENTWVFEELAEAGIEIDCSVFPAPRAHGGFPAFGAAEPVIVDVGGTAIKEFPINTVKVLGRHMVFSGGGYFRLLPYAQIRRWTRQSDYMMTYFHPRDFDPGQPVIRDLSMARRFKSYFGLGSAFGKLERLVDDFSFLDLRQAEQAVDWTTCRRIPLAALRERGQSDT